MGKTPLLLLAGCFLLGGCGTLARRDGSTRSGLTSAYASVLAAHDSNRDGRMSRDEVEAMVDLGWPRGEARSAQSEEVRDWLIAGYVDQDTNKDNYLTLAELLKEPLASFDCGDSNRDGRLSHREVEDAISRCPSATLHSRIGFISEPEAR